MVSVLYLACTLTCCAILVATPDTSDSGWVQQELQSMINRKNSGEKSMIILSFPPGPA
jgi:hypothetical protein